MPKKSSSPKKKKKVAIFTGIEDTQPFGVEVRDIIKTPLGQQVEVIGVKYEDPIMKRNPKLWVKYQTGHEAPIECMQKAQNIESQGYPKAPQHAHVLRDLRNLLAQQHQRQLERKAQQEKARLAALGLSPPAKDKKSKSSKKGKK